MVKNMTFKEIETGVWKPEKENDEIVGILLSKESGVGKNNSNIYVLEVDNKPMSVWGSTVLDPKMISVKLGQKIKIVYLGKGEEKPGRSPAKLFTVWRDDEDDDESLLN